MSSTLSEELAREWKIRLETECPNYDLNTRESIICWLLGDALQQWEELEPAKRAVAAKGFDFTYRILKQRYLGLGPEKAYQNLIQRLGGLVMLRQKIRAWVATTRDRQRTAIDVLQEVIQEMLNSDRYLQQKMAKIAECTTDSRLRNTLLLASLEEYCIRPIRNQPLLVYRFVNYLRRSQKGGLTQVPTQEWVQLLSEEISPKDTEDTVSLLDNEATSQYQSSEFWEQQQEVREQVREEFLTYLAEQVEPNAAEWLRLYLQGYSQEAIARTMEIPVRQIYRLREKVTYHAIRVFAIKQKPELVANWLEISLNENNLGLTASQWQEFEKNLSEIQRQIINGLKGGKSVEAIATELKIKTTQIIREWTQLYLEAQSLRNASQ
ncbi:MAG: HetZ-related protein 2 [Okeania sp. SIO2H7]|nr:HetZ-related protein 2 [Okeania sp. SIO2H7]